MASSSRKPSMGSTYITEKRISQWEELMRKFSESHKEQFKTASLDIPRAERSTKYLPTGSQYEGSWDVLGMSGYGKYTFPNGVVFEGDFEDGMFHGKGQLRYENGIVLRGHFVNGVLMERTLLSDNMEYSENNWKYCTMPDRRFEMEYETGLKPGGQSQLTAEQPTREIPPGFYDTGDGFYDPKTKVVYKYEDMTAILRSPTVLEQQWIVKNCRVNPEQSLGPCPELYEEFTEPVLKPEPPPPPAAGVQSAMASFRIQSMYEDFDLSSPQMYPSRSTIISTGTSGLSERRVSQYEDIMKKYSAINEESKCNYEDIPPPSPHTFKKFPTGSSYEGAFDINGMTGYGEYTFPNGVVYRGDFKDGMFHGQGELIYNEGPEADSIISGTWVNGILTERKILFNGTLEYDEVDWKYCKLPDRRFEVEFEEDLVSAGKTRITAEDPPREIPEGFYDTGDGFYNPKTKVVYDYKNMKEVTRGPSAREQKWIEENCRKKPIGVVGPRPDLYETWATPSLERAPLPKPLVGYRSLLKNPSVADQLSLVDQVYGTLFYDPSKRMLPDEEFDKLSEK